MKFEKIYAPEKNIDVHIIWWTNENDQCFHGWGKLEGYEIEESLLLVFQLKKLKQKNVSFKTKFQFKFLF